MNLLVLGPQGSGKGTQAARLSEAYGIPHVSTGEMFRGAIAAGSELGRRVEPILASGELVPDDLTAQLIRERLAEPDAERGFVLDGFPRNLAQAEALDAMLAEIGRGLEAVLFFDISDDVAGERLRGRAREERREDDAPEAIARRLEIYHEQTEPVVERYRASGKLVPVHAERTIDQVTARDRRGARVARRGGDRMIIRKGASEIGRIATAGTLVARTISHVGERIEPGITTLELDRIADDFIRENGGVPTSLGYRGYPRAICISVDEVVVHGIPDGRVVEEGDLVTIDVGVTLDGAIADSAYTFGIGAVDAEAQRLLDVCQDALAAGIAEARLGNRIGDISHAVQMLVEDAGFAVVKSLVGHGVGRHYHEDPHVPNFGEAGRGPRLSEGMTIAIEPMITMGRPDVVLAEDGWTISSADGSLAAHFEHTVAILPDGPRILTPRVGIAVERESLAALGHRAAG